MSGDQQRLTRSAPNGGSVPASAFTHACWVVLKIAGRTLLAFACVLLLIALFAPGAQAQISPGPLSRAHQQFDGAAGCTTCHAVSAGSPNFRCLDCHTEIAVRLRQRRGLHPSLMNGGSGNSTCVRCHSEHNGATFSLVRWDPSPKTFDHKQTGFVLEGKHAGLDCGRCHNAKNVLPAERASLKNLGKTFLGLSTSCTSCHEDKHRGQLGNNCLQCHNTTDWKKSFDHSKTRFTLSGAHVQVACLTCHKPGPDQLPQYRGLKFDRCAACHSDPHRAAFQQTCETCHTTASWKRTSIAARFDHSTTKFALAGKHQEVRCTTCHRSADFKTPIAHDSCASCHKPDPHNGQFARRADGGRCETCHSVDGFKPAKFVIADHNGSGFPLRGKHASVACAKCHVPAGKSTLFKVKFAACLDCHKDEHAGQFARVPYVNQCQQCHTESGFRPATFSLARHQKTGFVLTDGHVAVACIDCHKPVAPLRTAVYHFERTTCTTCHADPHENQFAQRMARPGADGRAIGCETCHSTKAWRDIGKFDHASTSFILSGTHRAVECAGCHRPPNLEQKLTNVNFKSAPSQCEECHTNPHGPQFARPDGVTTCAGCHTTTKWRPSLFNHDKTAFALNGAHKDVLCSSCHVNFRAVSGKSVLFYKPTPTACAACHGNNAASGK